MKKSGKFLIPGIVTAMILSFGIMVSHADEGKNCDQHLRHARFEGRGEHGFHNPHLAFRGLDLNDEQKAKVKEIFDQQKPAREQKFQALHESFKALHEATKAQPYDAKKVQDLAAQQAKLQSDLIVMRAEAAHQVYALLTPEQKQKWDQREQKKPRESHERS